MSNTPSPTPSGEREEIAVLISRDLAQQLDRSFYVDAPTEYVLRHAIKLALRPPAPAAPGAREPAGHLPDGRPYYARATAPDAPTPTVHEKAAARGINVLGYNRPGIHEAGIGVGSCEYEGRRCVFIILPDDTPIPLWETGGTYYAESFAWHARNVGEKADAPTPEATDELIAALEAAITEALSSDFIATSYAGEKLRAALSRTAPARPSEVTQDAITRGAALTWCSCKPGACEKQGNMECRRFTSRAYAIPPNECRHRAIGTRGPTVVCLHCGADQMPAQPPVIEGVPAPAHCCVKIAVHEGWCSGTHTVDPEGNIECLGSVPAPATAGRWKTFEAWLEDEGDDGGAYCFESNVDDAMRSAWIAAREGAQTKPDDDDEIDRMTYAALGATVPLGSCPDPCTHADVEYRKKHGPWSGTCYLDFTQMRAVLKAALSVVVPPASAEVDSFVVPHDDRERALYNEGYADAMRHAAEPTRKAPCNHGGVNTEWCIVHRALWARNRCDGYWRDSGAAAALTAQQEPEGTTC
ncbi:MAG: hypothetical protein JWN27_2920 [Candidatus Eremiobacteraeota bacterium]|nr:hypothetical protein [Candidatus Eremiobacteraeota bacterium]